MGVHFCCDLACSVVALGICALIDQLPGQYHDLQSWQQAVSSWDQDSFSKGMLDLTCFGHGLPMNAYPPHTFVTQGMYLLFSHPIYLGAHLPLSRYRSLVSI